MLIVILLVSLLVYLPAQPPKELVAQEPDQAPFKCAQPAAEQDALIRKAEAEGYIVRLIFFYGLARTRDQTLRRRLLLIEGDSFTRESLVKSLENEGRSQAIYPVRLSDVVIEIKDDGEKRVNTSFCFKERRR
jgi:outer membrane protein assembly factor BamA